MSIHEPAITRAISIAVDDDHIAADVSMPAHPRGVVVFAHGSGSSRFSVRNRAVAMALVRASFATVLADLLTPAEADEDERTRRLRFDIPRLAERVVHVIDWAVAREELRNLQVGVFGASTGAAAALVAAADRPDTVAAVVSRGGRPDLAGERLSNVRAPTLLIVGSLDLDVLRLNRQALEQIRCESRIEIVPGATHLFEEPGTLEEVTALAIDWFRQHLIGAPVP